MKNRLSEKRQNHSFEIRRQQKRTLMQNRRINMIESMQKQSNLLDIDLTTSCLGTALVQGNTSSLFEISQSLCTSLRSSPALLARQILASPTLMPLVLETLSLLQQQHPNPLILSTKLNLISAISSLATYPEMCEQMISELHMVEILAREIEHSAVNQLTKVLDFFSAVVILEQPFKQMWNRNILQKLITKIDIMGPDNLLQQAMVVYLYNFINSKAAKLVHFSKELDSNTRELMMIHAMRIIVFHYEFDEEMLELALLVLSDLIQMGTKYNHPYTPLIDIIKQPRFDKKLIVIVLRILQWFVYRSDEAAALLCTKTQFLCVFFAQYLHNIHLSIRRRCVHILYNLCTIRELSQLMEYFIANIVQQLIIEQDPQSRNHLFKALFEWCSIKRYDSFDQSTLRVLAHLSFNRVPHQDQQAQCEFWINVLEKYCNLPTPQYLLQFEDPRAQKIKELLDVRYGIMET